MTIGRIVHYVLDEVDCKSINRRRTTGQAIADRITTQAWPLGAQAHIGNPAAVGDTLPAIVVRVFGEVLNLQVFLDGLDVYWACNRHEDPKKRPGTWHWPVVEKPVK